MADGRPGVNPGTARRDDNVLAPTRAPAEGGSNT